MNVINFLIAIILTASAWFIYPLCLLCLIKDEYLLARKRSKKNLEQYLLDMRFQKRRYIISRLFFFVWFIYIGYLLSINVEVN